LARIFISHSRFDDQSAQCMKDWLESIGFDKTYLDFDDKTGTAPGEDWERRLYNELERSQAVILIVTKNWLASKWCFAEFAQARALGKVICAVIESPSGDHFVSNDIQHLDLTSNREGGLNRLERRLREVALEAQAGFEWARDRAPYPGLLSFEAADAAVFFGRDDDIRRAIERLNARRVQGGQQILAILGGSGSGKSSLLKAGILPRLSRDKEHFLVLPPFRPRANPVRELFNAFKAVHPELLRAQFDSATTPLSALELIDSVRHVSRAPQATLVISVDQGEELFSRLSTDARNEFFARLSVFLDPDHPVLATLTMRSDHLLNLQSADGLTARFEEFSLKPMPIERLSLIVHGPARVVGLKIEDALVKAIERDAKTQDALPLVAFILRQLYDRHASGGVLTAAHYEALRDGLLSPLEVVVREAAKEAFDETRATPDELAAFREAFVPGLVKVNDDGAFVRQAARLDELPIAAERLLRRLADARLLIIAVEDGVTRIEVAHEAIFRVWPLLTGWLEEEREFLIGKSRIEKAREDYAQLPIPEQTRGMLSGILLDRAKAWLIAHPTRFSTEELAFIRASAQQAERVEAERAAERERLYEAELARAKAEAARSEEQARAARRIESLYLTSLAQQANAYGDHGTAVALALEALPDEQRGIMRPYVPQAEATLFEAQLRIRERRIYSGHDGPVMSAAFSLDGCRVVTASHDKTARLWDVTNGSEIAVLRGHEDWVEGVSFSPDGSYIITNSEDNTARVWDAVTAEQIAVLSGHVDAVYDAAFSPDSSHIITASRDKTARLWDVHTGCEHDTVSFGLSWVLRGHTDAVYSAIFSPDSSRIISASRDNTVRLWDIFEKSEIAALIGHDDSVYSAVFSRDGHRIVSASSDQTARVWDAATGHELTVLRGHHGPVRSAAFSPDGKRVITTSDDATARLWDTAAGHEIAVLIGHEGPVTFGVFSSDGACALTLSDDSKAMIASSDNTARLWDVATCREIAVLRGHEDSVTAGVFSRDGNVVLTTSLDKTARLWDARVMRDVIVLHGHLGSLTSVAFSPDGGRIVTASSDNTARLWDSSSGCELGVLRGHVYEVNSATFSTDGTLVLTASSDHTARLWDITNCREIAVFHRHLDRIYSAAFSPDGKRIVTASADNTAQVWDVGHTSHPILTLRGHSDAVNSAVFSPDTVHILTASKDGTARLWDANAGREIVVLGGHGGPVNAAAFSRDVERVVTGSEDKTIRLWTTATGRELVVLRGHEKSITAVAFSPDGRHVVSASNDRTARVWDVASGGEIAVLSGHTRSLRSVEFSPDGDRVVTGSEDRTARVSTVFRRTQELIDFVRLRTPRKLTPEQRRRFSLE
jgi:WD40 repeat protein